MLIWSPEENSAGDYVYYHLCTFYFLLDLAPVLALQTPIHPSSVPPWIWLSQWLIDYSKQVGLFLDTPESISPKTLATFYAASGYHMEDYPVPEGGWKTFNEFFARHINPAVRPIDKPDDPTVIVMPADSKFDGQWPVNSKGNVELESTSIFIKHLEWSISRLLEDDEHQSYGDKFKDGVFMHS